MDSQLQIRIQRIREREKEAKRQRQRNARISRMLGIAVFFAISLLFFSGVLAEIDSPITNNDNADEEPGAAAVLSDWELVLVNYDNALPLEFKVDLAEFGSTRVDKRIAEQLRNMIEDAESEGISFGVTSGFRSVAEQRAIFESRVLSYMSQGRNYEESNIFARQYLQPGGMSEHHTGLAVDLISDGSNRLDESFANTAAYIWLKENAHKYGFIERYPKDKSEITGILWEPWHYRYVGINHAKEINSRGFSLEEYIEYLS